MRFPWVGIGAAGALSLFCIQPAWATSSAASLGGAGLVPATPGSVDALLAQALLLLKKRDYEPARAHLLRVRAGLAVGDPRFHDALLLLGICAYRLGQWEQAELELQAAAESSDGETQAQARLFLAQVLAEQGATDQAHRELSQAAGSIALRDSAERLLRQSRPHRLHITLLIAPELDGNVPLTPLYVDAPLFPAWQRSAPASMDGDMLFLASLGVRPLRHGLLFGNTLSYRQQLRLTDYNLLLNSTWLHFNHLTAANRLRLSAAVSLAVLGPSFLYVDAGARVQYRRRLHAQWGLAGTYEARYRDYRTSDFAALSGLSQSIQLELSYALVPQPLSFGIGYQGLREQTNSPASAMEQDFRAWVHGPLAWLRARLHKRLELSLGCTLLHRVFDSPRIDYALYGDVNFQISLSSWLSAYVSGSVLHNASTEPFFHYLKPSASLGFLAYIGLL